MNLKEARTMARQAAQEGDGGTNDPLVSDVMPDTLRGLGALQASH